MRCRFDAPGSILPPRLTGSPHASPCGRCDAGRCPARGAVRSLPFPKSGDRSPCASSGSTSTSCRWIPSPRTPRLRATARWRRTSASRTAAPWRPRTPPAPPAATARASTAPRPPRTVPATSPATGRAGTRPATRAWPPATPQARSAAARSASGEHRWTAPQRSPGSTRIRGFVVIADDTGAVYTSGPREKSRPSTGREQEHSPTAVILRSRRASTATAPSARAAPKDL